MDVIVLVFLLSVPFCSWGQGLSFSDSPDWKPLGQQQIERLRQLATQTGGEVVDAAGYVHGGGATVMRGRMPGAMNQRAANNYVAGLVHGVTKNGQKLVSQEPTKVATLPGSLLTFEGSTNGRPSSAVTYVLFDERYAYVLSISGSPGTTKDSPMVTSYLSRIKADPGLVPADLSNRAFELGQQAGKWLVRGVIVGVLLVLLVKLLRVSTKRRNAEQPPPLNF